MTIQEAGSSATWLEAVWKITSSLADYNPKHNDNSLGFSVEKVYVLLFAGEDNRVAMTLSLSENECIEITWYSGYIIRYNSQPTIFQLDTEGIRILIQTLRDTDCETEDDLKEACVKTDELYRKRFFGKLTGNKFGF